MATMIYTKAYAATILISVLPNLLLFLVPQSFYEEKDERRGINVQSILLCFASAGMLGDVFIHALPHLFLPHSHSHSHSHSESDSHSHDHNHNHDTCIEDDHNCLSRHLNEEHHSHSHSHSHSHDLWMGLSVEREMFIPLVMLIGVFTFFVVERIANKLLDNHQHSEKSKKSDIKKPHVDVKSKSSSSSAYLIERIYYNLKSSGYLNLLADSMHNFTDGIAIGSTFATGNTGGGLALATFLSVIFHEIPHEMGDLTILIQNGLSKTDAIKAQFMTAIAAMLGTTVGLFAERNKLLEELLLSFTAGGFLYIGTCGILPTVVKDESNSLSQIFLELIAFVLGVLMMVAAALLEGHSH